VKKILFCVSAVILISGISGCAHKTALPYPKVETVLTYNRPLDFIYLEILKAVEEIPNWELSNTEKSAGVVVLNNSEYWETFDADKRQAVLLIKSVDKMTTSVELAPESQSVIGGRDIIDTIEKRLQKYQK